MGRQIRNTAGSRPKSSGKVIFYRGRNLSEPKIQDEEVPTNGQGSKNEGSKNEANAQRWRSSSIRIGSFIAPQTNPLSISPTKDFHNSPLPSPIMPPDSPSNLKHHASASAQILLRLLKDACDLFNQVPYVKVVAGLVQEIIKISEVCVTF